MPRIAAAHNTRRLRGFASAATATAKGYGDSSNIRSRAAISRGVRVVDRSIAPQSDHERDDADRFYYVLDAMCNDARTHKRDLHKRFAIRKDARPVKKRSVRVR
jgi:hypothetical protein